MNYVTHIKPLEDQGKSDAQIAAILGTIRTSPIVLSELEAKLTLWGILSRDPVTNNRQGPLVTAATGDSSLKPVALQLLSWLGSARSQQLSTQTADVAPVWAAGIAAMVAGQVLTQSQADTLNSLGGSLQFPGVTEQQVTACRAAHVEAQEAAAAAQVIQAKRDQIRGLFDGILNQIGTSEQAQAVNTLRLIATDLEA